MSIDFPRESEWTSGFELAADASLLIHDAQYGHEEYAGRIGWGHSELRDLLAFATAARVRRVVPFHFDPGHTDAELDKRFDGARRARLPFDFVPGVEGATFEL